MLQLCLLHWKQNLRSLHAKSVFVEHNACVLFIKSGKVRVDFYDESKNYLESRTLNQGDVLLLAFGGHGFEMLEPSEIIEVKQGPYAGEQDKVRFDPVSSQNVIIR